MKSVLGSLVVIMFTCAASFAAPITIVNGDFESPLTAMGGDVAYGYTATGWTATGTDVWGNPGYADRSRVLRTNDAGWDWNFFGDNSTAFYAPGGMEVPRTPYGEQVESSFLGNGWMQVLSATLAANTTYTLQYDAGFGKDYAAPAGAYRVQIYAGDVMVMEVGEGWGLGGVVGAEFGQVATARNNWTHQTVAFTTSAIPAGLGGDLQIKIWNDGARTDNYTLDATAIPEPATLILLGLSGLLVRKYRA